MSTVYILTLYEYNSYTYDRTAVYRLYIHKTKEGAEKHAEELGYKITHNVKNIDKECTLEKEILYD